MNKAKIAVFAGIGAAAIVAVSMFAAQAQTALTASCGTSVSGNQVTWTSSFSGGNAPYSFLWNGDSSVAGATSTSLTRTYTTNGTYTASFQVTDASSSIATSTCTAIVSANVPPATTSTLNVIVAVNNTNGGSASSSNFLVTVNGAGATPSSFSGTGGTSVTVNGGQTYTVGASSVANYSASLSGNCTGPITAGATNTCTITETFVPPSISTSTLPRVNQPMLSVGPNGSFLARGMTVTSVSSGSFQAQVWGITYTVNWNGKLFPEFVFRDGKSAASSTNPSQQLAVGDEVSVSGKVTAASPLVVNANVVRDFNITMPRPPHGKGNDGDNDKDDNHGQNGNSGNSSSVDNLGQRLNDLLSQFKNLQGFFNSHFGGH